MKAPSLKAGISNSLDLFPFPTPPLQYQLSVLVGSVKRLSHQTVVDTWPYVHHICLLLFLDTQEGGIFERVANRGWSAVYNFWAQPPNLYAPTHSTSFPQLQPNSEGSVENSDIPDDDEARSGRILISSMHQSILVSSDTLVHVGLFWD